MANAEFSFDPFDFGGVQDGYSPLQGFEREEVNKGYQTHLFETEGWGDTDYIYSEFGFCKVDTTVKGDLVSPNQNESFSDLSMLDDFYFDIPSLPIQSCQEPAELDTSLTGIPDPVEPKKKSYPIPLSSLELLKAYKSGFKSLNGDRFNEWGSKPILTTVGGRELSTEEVMRVAGARYIQYSVPMDDDLAMLRYPFGCSLSGLTIEETKDVELAQFLLASAEKVGNRQFERARKLLYQCDHMSSKTGNPVQRVIYYFANALHEKIDRETGKIPSKQLEDLEVAMMSPNKVLLAWHQELPFNQVLQFAGVQAIIEGVASAKKVHLIDLGIGIGLNWTILMQALATTFTDPLEHFKVTFVTTTSKHKIEETGKRLESFAETMNIRFSFKVVFVSDMKDLKEDLFELEADEAVAVCSSFSLRTMISRPDCLEALMRVIRNLNPCIMVVNEVEANHNSPSFVKRFIEALFFYSVFFDCLEDCMDRRNPNRMISEGIYFGQAIWNIVATEGQERTLRHVKIDVWRAFFARFGMVETELSQSSLYQASLVVKQFSCGSSCTLNMNGKCLTVGWKGTPLLSLSVWKFHQEKDEIN